MSDNESDSEELQVDVNDMTQTILNTQAYIQDFAADLERQLEEALTKNVSIGYELFERDEELRILREAHRRDVLEIKHLRYQLGNEEENEQLVGIVKEEVVEIEDEPEVPVKQERRSLEARLSEKPERKPKRITYKETDVSSRVTYPGRDKSRETEDDEVKVVKVYPSQVPPHRGSRILKAENSTDDSRRSRHDRQRAEQRRSRNESFGEENRDPWSERRKNRSPRRRRIRSESGDDERERSRQNSAKRSRNHSHVEDRDRTPERRKTTPRSVRRDLRIDHRRDLHEPEPPRRRDYNYTPAMTWEGAVKQFEHFEGNDHRKEAIWNLKLTRFIFNGKKRPKVIPQAVKPLPRSVGGLFINASGTVRQSCRFWKTIYEDLAREQQRQLNLGMIRIKFRR